MSGADTGVEYDVRSSGWSQEYVVVNETARTWSQEYVVVNETARTCLELQLVLVELLGLVVRVLPRHTRRAHRLRALGRELGLLFLDQTQLLRLIRSQPSVSDGRSAVLFALAAHELGGEQGLLTRPHGVALAAADRGLELVHLGVERSPVHLPSVYELAIRRQRLVGGEVHGGGDLVVVERRKSAVQGERLSTIPQHRRSVSRPDWGQLPERRGSGGVHGQPPAAQRTALLGDDLVQYVVPRKALRPPTPPPPLDATKLESWIRRKKEIR